MTVAHSEKLKPVQYSKSRVTTLCFMDAPRNCDCSECHHWYCDSLWCWLASKHRTGFLPGLPQIPTPFSWMTHSANMGKWTGKGQLDTQTKGDCQEEARVEPNYNMVNMVKCYPIHHRQRTHMWNANPLWTLDFFFFCFFSFFLIYHLLLNCLASWISRCPADVQ